MKASISLFGSCTADNIFYYAAKDGKNQYLVRNRFFQLSPVSLMLSEPVAPLLDFEPAGQYESAIRSIKIDIEKSIFSAMEKKRTDYIIIDATGFDGKILRINYGGRIYYLSWMYEISTFNAQAIFNALKQAGASYKILNRESYFELFEPAIEAFCKRLLEFYSPEQIILLKTYPTNLCIHDDYTLDYILPRSFDEKKFVLEAFRIYTKYLDGCHIIDTLDYMLSSYDAVYGIHPFHYEKGYYEYCLECIGIITDSCPVEEEARKLKQFKEQYSGKMRELYQNGINKLIEKNRKIRETQSYEQYQADHLGTLNGTWLKRVREFYKIKESYSPLYANGKGLYQLTDLNEYVRFLVENAQGYVLFFAVRDNVSVHWGRFVNRNLLGLNTDVVKWRASYLAVVDMDEKNVMEFYDNSSRELKYHCDIVIRDRNIILEKENAALTPLLNYCIDISSKGWEYGYKNGKYYCWAKIMINNVDYAINKKGLNGVVFSKREHCVVDSFHVDMHGDAALKICR